MNPIKYHNNELRPVCSSELMDLDIVNCSHPFVWYLPKRWATEVIKMLTYKKEYWRNVCRKKSNKTFMASHTARIIRDGYGNISVVEATIMKGIVPQSLFKWSIDYDDIDVVITRKEYNLLEKNIAHDYIKKVWGSTGYDFAGLFYQLYYIAIGKWIGPKGRRAQSRQYCSEFDNNIDSNPNAYKMSPKQSFERSNAVVLGKLEKKICRINTSRGRIQI